MVKKIICIIVFSCILCCGCSETKILETASKSDVSDNETIKRNDAKENFLDEYEEKEYYTAYTDFGSNDYWCDVMINHKNEIEEMIYWFKNVKYCKSLAYNSAGFMRCLPDDEKTRENIKTEKNYNIIKKIMVQREYNVSNTWEDNKRIIILREFEKEGVRGNYCLVYLEGKLKKTEKNYRKVCENYYSMVVFYE